MYGLGVRFLFSFLASHLPNIGVEMKAKPKAKPVSIRETYRDTLKRFPKTMKLLSK